MSDRAEFEKYFRRPDGVFWDNEFCRYEANEMEYELDADEYNTMCQVWEAACAQSRQDVERVTNDRRAFWQELQSFVDDYVSGYEFQGDGDYTPNEKEQFLIEDYVAGLLYELRQEGYFYAQPQLQGQQGSVSDYVNKAFQRLIENGGNLGPASR
jgi:hypothetical protein